ncbi:hypothetical protein K2224_33165 (plasmid) [Streptomyces sp. BHT-5-2]|uniref:hypothetical protein n=1 Tax=unclassified Streptomyces TaxID=2593676 RepID=UPI001C8D5381|nr:hypothetical protein [Streptomyces sp. BHT-5-2]QZL08017.1 hypothetical protein K2224_33165 [Streptomyces sp. BHT-5-2]
MTFKVFFPRNRKTSGWDCDDWGYGCRGDGYGYWRRGGWRGGYGGIVVIVR